MSSPAQISANQNNAIHSTGPRTEEGKQSSSHNNFRHGLASNQILIEGEDPAEFDALRADFFQEHQPATPTETALVNGMAQHLWLSQRALRLQTSAFTAEGVDEKKLSLYLRYQSTHDRAFHKCLTEIMKLRSLMAKELIGFESQKQKQALNDAKIRAHNARAEASEIDTDIRTTIEAPLPGNLRIPFETMKSVFEAAVREVTPISVAR